MSDFKLDLEGNTETVSAWLSQIDAAGTNARFIGPHITAIRVGSYPPTFVENLHTLDEDTVLALAASKSSIWSQPIYGTSIPDKAITVREYLGHIQSQRPKQYDDTDDERVDSREIEDTKAAQRRPIDTEDEVDEPTSISSSAASAMRDELTTSAKLGKRSDTPASPLPRRPCSSVLAYHGRHGAKCEDFNKHTEKAIAFMRGTMTFDACNILDTIPEYQDAVAKDNLLGVFDIILHNALFTSCDEDVFAEEIRKALESDPKYKLSTSGLTLANFANKYVRTFQMLKYADPSVKEAYIVRAFVKNLPTTPRYSQSRSDLAGRAISYDPRVEEAKVDLGKAIRYVTHDVFNYNSLNPQDPDHAASGPKTGGGTRPKPPATEPVSAEDRHLKTLILSLTASLDASRGNQRSRPSPRTTPAAYGSEICHQFAAGRCRHGDNCKYDHSTLTKPDHRIQGGAMLPKYAAAVQAHYKTYYKQRDEDMAKRNSYASAPSAPSALAALKAPDANAKRILRLNSENAMLRSSLLAKIAADDDSDTY